MFVVAGRDPDVARPDPRAEGMGRHVEPPALEIESDGRRDGLAEDLLAVGRVRPLEDRGSCTPRLAAWPVSSLCFLAPASPIAWRSGTSSSRSAWNRKASSPVLVPGS